MKMRPNLNDNICNSKGGILFEMSTGRNSVHYS